MQEEVKENTRLTASAGYFSFERKPLMELYLRSTKIFFNG